MNKDHFINNVIKISAIESPRDARIKISAIESPRDAKIKISARESPYREKKNPNKVLATLEGTREKKSDTNKSVIIKPVVPWDTKYYAYSSIKDQFNQQSAMFNKSHNTDGGDPNFSIANLGENDMYHHIFHDDNLKPKYDDPMKSK